MLSEFVLSPAIFRTASYESSAMADVCLRPLGKTLLYDCIVRDLGSGEWREQLSEQPETLHAKGKELLKKLQNQGRLSPYPLVGPLKPENDLDWEAEGLSSHQRHPVDGLIFSSESNENRHSDNKLVSSPELLPNASFWGSRPCSKRIPRLFPSYLKVLEPFLRHATSMMLIDPHLDPSVARYRDLGRLFASQALMSRDLKPRIEVHRVCWIGDGRDKKSNAKDIEEIFRSNWESDLRSRGLAVEVFLWDDFHDRFFLTNLLGLSWSNGFDTTTDPSSTVTVAKLSRADLDEVQKEFTANSNMHRSIHKFRIGS